MKNWRFPIFPRDGVRGAQSADIKHSRIGTGDWGLGPASEGANCQCAPPNLLGASAHLNVPKRVYVYMPGFGTGSGLGSGVRSGLGFGTGSGTGTGLGSGLIIGPGLDIQLIVCYLDRVRVFVLIRVRVPGRLRDRMKVRVPGPH